MVRTTGCADLIARVSGWSTEPTYTRQVTEDGASGGFQSIGQTHAETLVRTTLAPDRGTASLLIHGPTGAGKGAFATDVIALLMCEATDPGARPCNECRSCRLARAGTHPDLVIGSPGAWQEARSTGESTVAAARRWLADASGAPISGTRRVVLVEQLERAGEDIQNVLLKALEEPTPRHLYLLLSDEPSRLLPTIRSRVQSVRIGPLPRGTLVALLMDLDRLPEEQALALARLSGGLAGRARRFAQRPEWLDWRRTTQTELLALLTRGWADRMAAARELIEQASRLTPRSPTADVAPDEPEAVRVPASAQRAAALAVTDAWIDLGRDLLVSAAGHPDQAASRELFADLEQTGRRIGAPALTAVLGVLDTVRDGIESNANPRLALEAAMLTWPRVAVEQP